VLYINLAASALILADRQAAGCGGVPAGLPDAKFVRAVDYTLTAARAGAAAPGASRISSVSSGGKLAPLFGPAAAGPAPRC
jgi:hypothetical protein